MRWPKYRVAIIACGQIARSHAYGWQQVPEAEIWTIADTNADARREFGEHFGVLEERRYADLRQMLDQERPDFVSVCSWHPLHAEFTIAAAARKPKAIICDKPMATSLAEADEMIVACSRERVKLAIGHQRRFLAAWQEAARLVREGAIGEPLRACVNAGVGLLNNATHSIDMMRYLLGDPAAEWVMGNVQRRTDRYERSIPCEEHAVGAVGFANGAVGTVLSGLPLQGRQPWVQVFGSAGTIEVGIGTPDPTKRAIRDDGSMRVSERFPSAHYNDEEGTARILSAGTDAWQPIDVPFRDPFAGRDARAGRLGRGPGRGAPGLGSERPGDDRDHDGDLRVGTHSRVGAPPARDPGQPAPADDPGWPATGEPTRRLRDSRDARARRGDELEPVALESQRRLVLALARVTRALSFAGNHLRLGRVPARDRLNAQRVEGESLPEVVVLRDQDARADVSSGPRRVRLVHVVGAGRAGCARRSRRGRRSPSSARRRRSPRDRGCLRSGAGGPRRCRGRTRARPEPRGRSRRPW